MKFAMLHAAADAIFTRHRRTSFENYVAHKLFFLSSHFLAGKMFKSAELPWLITFFQMFYNEKPVDWLLGHLIDTKVCNWEKDTVSRRNK